MKMKEVKEIIEREPTADLNVVILPSNEVSEQVEEWSRKIAEVAPTFFTLDRSKGFLPHLSIYNSQYPKRNQPAVEEKLRSILSGEQVEVEIHFSGISHYNNTGFIFYDAVPNPALQRFHEEIVDVLNPLREGMIPDIAQTLQLPEPEMKSIRSYGGLVKDVYPPHITVSRLKNPADFQKISETIESKKMSFNVSNLALAPFAAHGTCPKPLQVYNLQ